MNKNDDEIQADDVQIQAGEIQDDAEIQAVLPLQVDDLGYWPLAVAVAEAAAEEAGSRTIRIVIRFPPTIIRIGIRIRYQSCPAPSSKIIRSVRAEVAAVCFGYLV